MSLLVYIAVLLGSIASFDDLRRRAIANWINLAGLAAGLVYHAAARGWAGLAWSAGGAAAGFAVFLIFYCLGGMGAGDLKLSAAFGALLGPSGILLAALLAAPLGHPLAETRGALNALFIEGRKGNRIGFPPDGGVPV